MLIGVKRCIEQNDIRGLHYIFAEALEVDPTFEKYQEDYDVCKKIRGFLEEYEELHPLLEDQAAWDEDYWVQLKLDQKKNFSDKRMEHMKRVVLVVRSEKAARLLAERQSVAPEPVPQPKQEPVQPTRPEPVPVPVQQTEPELTPYPVHTQTEKFYSMPQVEPKPVEETRRPRKEDVVQKKSQKEEQYTKKSMGIVLGIAILLIIIAVVFLMTQGNPN